MKPPPGIIIIVTPFFYWISTLIAFIT